MVIHRVFAISQHHSLNGIIKSIVREEYLQFLKGGKTKRVNMWSV